MINVAKVCVRFGDTVALEDVSLEIARGERVTIIGPNGCGKTTLLRAMIGLVQPESGTVHVGDFSTKTTPPHLLPVSMTVPLLPHYTVYRYLMLCLECLMPHRPELHEERITWVTERLVPERIWNKHTAALSDGERQRVVLAATLLTAIEKPVKLFDEPFRNLDILGKTEALSKLRELFGEIDATVVYVTHDPAEALDICGTERRVVVMRGAPGQIVQVGTFAELIENPRTEFVRQFVGVWAKRHKERAAQLSGLHVSAKPPTGGA